MNKRIIITLMIVMLVMLSGCLGFDYAGLADKNPDQEKELTVMAWNIWRGGTHAHDRDYDGRETIAAMINHSGADVLLMQETYGVEDYVIENTELEHAVALENVAIFSKYPILQFRKVNEWKLAKAIIDVKGTPVQVASVWIDWEPGCEYLEDVVGEKTPEELVQDEFDKGGDEISNRITDINYILDNLEMDMEMADEFPLIIGGDFNSHSHLDWVEETGEIFDHANRVVPWTVSKTVIEAGFKDSYRDLNPFTATMTTAELEKIYAPTWIGGGNKCRIDYIYYMGNKIEATASHTFNVQKQEPVKMFGKTFDEYPSDHGLVLTTFALNGE